MQNIDFYESNNNIRTLPPQYNMNEQEYFQTIPPDFTRDQEKSKKRASRLILFITSLCIISFTVGIVIGIKFAGGTKREIVDKQTYSAVADLSHKVTNLLKKESRVEKETTNTERFPKNIYPYVIKIDDFHNAKNSKHIATLLSNQGFTVILSKHNDGFKIYTGPYKNISDADKSLNNILTLNTDIINNVRVIKR